MRDAADIAAFIERQPHMARLLALVESLGLPDSWIGAGFVRNRIWDAQSRIVRSDAPDDVDVVYFDRIAMVPERDAAIEAQLSAHDPSIRWSVKNQARMHLRNGDSPYADSLDAIRHWPETATAVAARSIGGRIEVIAPFGVDDLVNLVVRPTPAFTEKLDIYRGRVQQKGWQARWPRLTFLGT